MFSRKNVITSVGMSREDLELMAIDVVCACLYYDLVDTLQETPDAELVIIIDRGYCRDCDQLGNGGL